ncbi:MAG: LysM peptidoglycan-binding domain-containing protein [Anaerolineales bacterium]|nr:LysM peptidoglycan-binding domain-containing protein [Anaerolineales bacterium]
MTSSSKPLYFLLVLALIFVLTGCELARDNSEVSDMSPLEALPPTLAPLGAQESALVSEATAVPTVLSVQATMTPAALAASEAKAEPIELVAPTAQPSSVSAEPKAEESEATAPEAETPGQSIVVDATTPEQLPEEGPIATNPPVSNTNPVIQAASPGGTYTVQAGDTLFSISQRYGTSIEAIAAANGLTSDLVQIGQALTIPDGSETYPAPYGGNNYAPAPVPALPSGPGDVYIVSPSDTLFSIAMRYGTSVEAIASANNIVYPYIIREGQPLIIPGNDGSFPVMPPNGYAPDQGYPQQPPMDGYYQQPDQGYYQQPPVDGYYQQPDQGYYQQPPMDGYYQQPDQGYYQQPGQGYPQQPPVDGYYQQPGQGYAQPPTDGYYQQPGQGYVQPGQEGSYYPAPGAMPGGAGTHTVAAGETLYSIARRYGVPAEAIAAANGLANPNQLFVGQVLYLP